MSNFINLILRALVVAIVFLFSGTGYASDGSLSLSGTLTATTCTATGNGASTDFTVTLPKVGINSLKNLGDVAGAITFTLGVKDCTNVTGISVFFESVNGSISSNRIANALTTGKAANVSVQIKNPDGSSLTLSGGKGSQGINTSTLGTSATTGYATFVANYYATAQAGAGGFSGAVTYTMVYS
jgi:major type 1 subunit fimbrin (pilin)